MNISKKFGYSEKVPENIREPLALLCEDLMWLNLKWDMYQELFGESNNLKVATESASTFFMVVEESLREDMAMSIGRLNDPANDGKKFKNLSLERLVQDSGIDGIESLRLNFREACFNVEALRNKRVAHKDLHTSIDPIANPIPGISKKQVDEIIKFASQLLSTIYQNFTGTTLYFGMSHTRGVGSLIRYLQVGLDHADD